jgi:hypothetical protein
MKAEIECRTKIPEGWDAVAYGLPKKGEWFLDVAGPVHADYDWDLSSKLIIRKVERWVRLSFPHFVSERRVARFRDNSSIRWMEGTLTGTCVDDEGRTSWLDDAGCGWDICEVLER